MKPKLHRHVLTEGADITHLLIMFTSLYRHPIVKDGYEQQIYRHVSGICIYGY